MKYRLFYWETINLNGLWVRQVQFKIIEEPIGRIETLYRGKIYYLTDMNGNVIIDNRSRKREEKW